MADPDVHIREGPSHPDPEMRGGGAGLQKNFLGLQPLVWSKSKALPPPPDLPLDFSGIMTLNGT